MSKFIEIISDTDRAIINLDKISFIYKESNNVIRVVVNNSELRFFFSNIQDVPDAMSEFLQKIQSK